MLLVLKATAELGAAEGHDGIGAGNGLVHSGALRRVPIATLHPASTTPVEVHQPQLRPSEAGPSFNNALRIGRTGSFRQLRSKISLRRI